jgi:type IX secretion system PorP/SprF family membrane protein
MKKLLLIAILLWSSVAWAQNAPAFRQFYFNPFLFNPAFAGVHDYAQASVLYRQQWAGFNNAPSAGGFTLQLPSSNRASFGLSVLSQEVVALQTNTAQATFAYRIPISASQFLFFGISGVAGINNLKPDADYSNDPTILNAAASTSYFDANFGLIYALGSLRVGFAFPKLLGQKYFSPEDLVNVRYSQLRNQLYSVSYKFKSGDFSFEPYAMYRVTRDLQNWWEGAAVVYYKEKIWLGGSYHSTQGAGFFLGFDIKEKLRVGYSYELPPVDKEFVSVNSHEIQLQVRLGKKKVFKWASRYEKKGETEVAARAEVIPAVVQDTAKVKVPTIVETEKTVIAPVIEKPVTEKTEAKPQPVVAEAAKVIEKITPPARPPVQVVLAPGLYIIAGSFRTMENARVLVKKLTDAGFADTKAALNTTNNMYYVYVFSSYDLEECRKARDQFRLKAATKDAWILKIQ